MFDEAKIYVRYVKESFRIGAPICLETTSAQKKTADNIQALKGVSSAKERFSRYGGRNKGKQPQIRSGGRTHS